MNGRKKNIRVNFNGLREENNIRRCHINEMVITSDHKTSYELGVQFGHDICKSFHLPLKINIQADEFMYSRKTISFEKTYAIYHTFYFRSFPLDFLDTVDLYRKLEYLENAIQPVINKYGIKNYNLLYNMTALYTDGIQEKNTFTHYDYEYDDLIDYKTYKIFDYVKNIRLDFSDFKNISDVKSCKLDKIILTHKNHISFKKADKEFGVSLLEKCKASNVFYEKYLSKIVYYISFKDKLFKDKPYLADDIVCLFYYIDEIQKSLAPVLKGSWSMLIKISGSEVEYLKYADSEDTNKIEPVELRCFEDLE